ncbi:thiolase family protein [Halorarius litoreus]|uniref:thiolase family protein n=1 Tax=Halorarius litoreus TaxID=2962676 RepID=UPI0020CE4790|nr:thiolase family protein [Halorarius litoreus]
MSATTGGSIVGWAETERFGRIPEKDLEELNQQVAYDAIADAGLELDDVDGLVASAPTDEPAGLYVSELAEELGLVDGLRHGSTGGIGGASTLQNLHVACQQVASGQCENILVIGCGKLATGSWGDEADAVEQMASIGHAQFETPYGPFIPSMYALPARRHMHDHGTTPEQLAKLTAIHYDHAAMQPDERSFTNETKTPEEILESPMIASPLTLDQCSLVTDGGCGIVVTSEERAHADYDVPVDVVSFGEHATHEKVHQMQDLTRTGAREASQAAFEAADLDHDDIDVVELYDCFSITVLQVLEDLGFCEYGEGGALVDSGELELDGKWPLNTHGGELAQSHHGPSGLLHVVEAVRQLRGEGGPTQVEDAEHALVHGNGGVLSCQNVAILERGD